MRTLLVLFTLLLTGLSPGLCAESAPAAAPHTGDAFVRCGDCHVPTGWYDLRPSGGSAFDHGATGFPLRGQHAAQGCTACHKGQSLRSASCTNCHADVHQHRNGDRCDACHTTQDWRLPEALAVHERTRFPLQGRHLTVPCRNCHTRANQNVWKGVDSRCVSCHREDGHGHTPAHDRVPFTTTCDACHTAYGFSPARVDHGRWWSLTGAHTAASCDDCHPNRRYAGTPRACYGCHAGDFAEEHKPGDDQGCADCHSTSAWQPTHAFDHDFEFPFPHHGVDTCASCHPGGTKTLTCMSCHTHARSRTDRNHREVRGYVYEARSCFRCHPRGRS